MNRIGKKILSVLLCMSLVCSMAAVCAFASTGDMVRLGDVNASDTVNAVDARFVLQSAANMRQFSAAESTAADINQDGKINAVDARWILQIASGRRLALMLDTQTGAVALEAQVSEESSPEEALAFFNLVLNRVKPFASSVTVTRQYNSIDGAIEGEMSDSLRDMVTQLVEENCGEVDVSDVPPATTTAEKNDLFPVEGEGWSSRLTVEDIEDITVQTDADTYTITVRVKSDPVSADTQWCGGHFGKAFAVLTPEDFADDSAGGMMQEIKTGNRGGTIAVSVDRQTGNVLSATYDGVWVTAVHTMGNEMILPLRTQTDYVMAW